MGVHMGWSRLWVWGRGKHRETFLSYEPDALMRMQRGGIVLLDAPSLSSEGHGSLLHRDRDRDRECRRTAWILPSEEKRSHNIPTGITRKQITPTMAGAAQDAEQRKLSGNAQPDSHTGKQFVTVS